MKKTAIIALAATICASMSAQPLKQNIMEGYNVSDALEKYVYADKNDAIHPDTWCAGYVSSPIEYATSPVVGEPLAYAGYGESGPSILLGSSFNDQAKGRRVSVYSITEENKALRGGQLYLSFLVNFENVGTKSQSPLTGLSASYTGAGGNRGTVYVRRDADRRDTYYFGVRLIEETVDCPQAFHTGETYLVVLKIDYTTSQASLFVNPDLSAAEPQPCAVSADGTLKHAIRSIIIRDYHNYDGRIGNFRLARTWADLAD